MRRRNRSGDSDKEATIDRPPGDNKPEKQAKTNSQTSSGSNNGDGDDLEIVYCQVRSPRQNGNAVQKGSGSSSSGAPASAPIMTNINVTSITKGSTMTMLKRADGRLLVKGLAAVPEPGHYYYKTADGRFRIVKSSVFEPANPWRFPAPHDKLERKMVPEPATLGTATAAVPPLPLGRTPSKAALMHMSNINLTNPSTGETARLTLFKGEDGQLQIKGLQPGQRCYQTADGRLHIVGSRHPQPSRIAVPDEQQQMDPVPMMIATAAIRSSDAETRSTMTPLPEAPIPISQMTGSGDFGLNSTAGTGGTSASSLSHEHEATNATEPRSADVLTDILVTFLTSANPDLDQVAAIISTNPTLFIDMVLSRPGGLEMLERVAIEMGIDSGADGDGDDETFSVD